MTVEVSSWTDLDAIRDDLSGDYVLTTDLDSSDIDYAGIGDDFEPIGSQFQSRFGGSFDGQGHTIADLVIATPSDGYGLFAGISGATLTDLTLSNVGIQSGADSHTGALVGFVNSGNVERVVTEVSISADSGRRGTGGLLGSTENNTTVRDCVTVGSVDGDERVGGLIGNTIAGTVERCYSLADVSGTDDRIGGLAGLHSSRASIAHSFAAGTVSGPDAGTGGLLGPDSPGAVDKSYWDIDATGQTDSGGGTGLSTADMTGDAAVANMTGFRFGFEWSLVTADNNSDADDYPLLRTLPVASQDALRTASITDYRVVPIALSTTATNDPAIDEATVEVRWTDSAVGEDGYRIYRSLLSSPTFPDDFTVLTETQPDTETHTDDSAAFDADHEYRVAAFADGTEATPRAAETIAVGSPGPFTVQIVDTNSPVGVGETLELDVELTNESDLGGETTATAELTEQ